MWHGVPFACQRRPIVGVLRMCWLLPGSFDCVCCPHTSVHRPSIACLAVFLCGPGALFLHSLSGPSTICSFPPHGWSAPDGLPLVLRKQPIWATGDTPHLPVEQGLPWHPVATGLAGQAIPFIVAASHAHALPSPPFWFSVPAVPVASPALLCPSSLSAVPALVPPGVAPAFCVSPPMFSPFREGGGGGLRNSSFNANLQALSWRRGVVGCCGCAGLAQSADDRVGGWMLGWVGGSGSKPPRLYPRGVLGHHACRVLSAVCSQAENPRCLPGCAEGMNYPSKLHAATVLWL